MRMASQHTVVALDILTIVSSFTFVAWCVTLEETLVKRLLARRCDCWASNYPMKPQPHDQSFLSLSDA